MEALSSKGDQNGHNWQNESYLLVRIERVECYVERWNVQEPRYHLCLPGVIEILHSAKHSQRCEKCQECGHGHYYEEERRLVPELVMVEGGKLDERNQPASIEAVVVHKTEEEEWDRGCEEVGD